MMPSPRPRAWSNGGAPAAGCKLFTYAAGTTTPKDTWQDALKTVKHENPITLDAKGEASIYWEGNYRVDLRTAAGVSITGYPVDNFETPLMADALAEAGSSAMIGNGGETVAASFNALQLASYAALRGYSGPRTCVYVTGVLAGTNPGIAGMFVCDNADTASADNAGTIIVAGNGKRWKRVFSGAVDVQWFGYVPDYNGTTGTDNAPAINAAHATMNNGGTLSFPRGAALTLSTVYIPYGVSWIGAGLQHTPNILAPSSQGTMIVGKHSGAATVSLKGAYACRIEGMVISGHPTTPPRTLLCLGRSSTNSAGRHSFNDINVVGWCTKAAIYCIGSEENVWNGLRANVLGGGAQYTLFASQNDTLAVDAINTGGCYQAYFYGSNILHQADNSTFGTATYAIFIEAGVDTLGWHFDGGFTGMTSQVTGSSHIRIQMVANGASDITFQNWGCESTNGANTPLQNLYVGGPGFTLKGLVFRNVVGGQVQSGQPYFIRCQSGVTLDNADIRCSKADHQSVFSILKNSTVAIPTQDIHIETVAIGNNLIARQLYLTETTGNIRTNNIAQCPTFGKLGFAGAGVNDMSIDPTSVYTGAVLRNIAVEIDGATAPNTFKWSIDGGVTWVATLVSITANVAQLLQDGIYIKFIAGTGHTVTNRWAFTAEPNVLMG